jgi:hypothetical protein
MATQKAAHPFNVGDRVGIRHSDWVARIVEFRGPLGPGGMLVFRVRVAHKPKPIYIEVREDQLVAMPTPPKLKASQQSTTFAPLPRPPKINSKKRPRQGGRG